MWMIGMMSVCLSFSGQYVSSHVLRRGREEMGDLWPENKIKVEKYKKLGTHVAAVPSISLLVVKTNLSRMDTALTRLQHTQNFHARTINCACMLVHHPEPLCRQCKEVANEVSGPLCRYTLFTSFRGRNLMEMSPLPRQESYLLRTVNDHDAMMRLIFF